MSEVITFPGASKAEAPGTPAAKDSAEVVETPRAPRAEFLGAAVEAVLFAVFRNEREPSQDRSARISETDRLT